MELQLLGDVALSDAYRQISLGTPRQRCVFAVLATTPAQAVPIDTLVDRVWGPQPPREVRNVLYSHVSRLRRAIRQAGSAGGRAVVRRASGGYLLDVPPDQIDLHRARRLVSEARRLSRGAASDPPILDRARESFRAGYELLSRPPLVGLAGAWVDRNRIAIGQERLAVATELYEIELRLGRHLAVLGELSELVAEHPLAEPLAGMLMRALYRAGRQADALDVYAWIRQQLVAAIGDDPGPDLRRLHARILRRDLDMDGG